MVINNYGKGYDRSGDIKDLQRFDLTLGEDGERPKESLAEVMARGLDVKLARVEILDNDGTVEIAENPTDYFYIVDLGDSSKKLTERHLTFNKP